MLLQEPSQIEFRLEVILPRRGLVPAHGFFDILLDPHSRFIALRQIELGLRMPLFRRRLVPPHRRRLIRLGPDPLFQTARQVQLCRRESLFGRGLQQRQGPSGISAHQLAFQEDLGQPVLRVGVPATRCPIVAGHRLLQILLDAFPR